MANRRGLLYQMLEDLRNQTGKNPDELAATLGISNATMYKRIRTGSFTYEDLFRMSETLGYTFTYSFQKKTNSSATPKFIPTKPEKRIGMTEEDTLQDLAEFVGHKADTFGICFEGYGETLLKNDEANETLEHITKLTQYVPDKSVKIILYSFHMDILAIVILQDCSTPDKKHYLLKTVWEQNTDNERHS